MKQRIFVDANILVSKTLRDWLFLLRDACPGMFQTHTSEDVLIEVAKAWRERRPTLSGQKLQDFLGRLRDVLDEVITDFDEDVSFTGRDPKDYHVYAAAVKTRADMLLTNNRPSDFADDSAPLEIITADELFLLIASSSPEALHQVIVEQARYWADRNGKPLDQALRDAHCPRFAVKVHEALRRAALRGDY